MTSVAESRVLLRRLGSGESIDALCQSQGWTRAQFDAWWRDENARRRPTVDGTSAAPVAHDVTIRRDEWGIPHVQAELVEDLWCGFGFAMAQDRLFQLDFLRRKGLGRLAEVLGSDGVALDLVARTVGLNRVAAEELGRLPAETYRLLEAFSRGVNAWIEQAGDLLPIEFDLLDYRPEPWSPLDSVAIEVEFRWYLTGRFPVIVMPELAKRTLGDGPLYRSLLLGEADEEAVVPREAYADRLDRTTPAARGGAASSVDARSGDRRHADGSHVGQTGGDPEGTGSNNWVVAGRHSRSGKPLVASDPHIAIEAVSCWYEVHLSGGGFEVAGIAYAGVPAVLLGRNRRIAWGITNNICSQRDLYQERTDAAHPDCFLFDGQWEPARTVRETIQVRGGEPIVRDVRLSRHGPIVDEILPPPGNTLGPVSLKWLGHTSGGWLTSLLAIDRAGNVDAFREACRPWRVPTFNLVVGDVDGRIGVQCTGGIPQRQRAERGFREGWNPADEWHGILPFEEMPAAFDPPRGWLVSANNRVVGNDYPHGMHGTWISGHRAQRIRNLLESGIAAGGTSSPGAGPLSLDEFRRMHYDFVSLRARASVPNLIRSLADDPDPRVQSAIGLLNAWDGVVHVDSAAALLFNVFFTRWSKEVSTARFTGLAAELLAKQVEGLASRLLDSDPLGWFPPGECAHAVRRVMKSTWDYLVERFGAAPEAWRWGAVHRMPLRHVLSNRGELSQLLDHGGPAVPGDMITVGNTGSGPDWIANTGAGYRFVADLAADGHWAVDASSQSGAPGSPHYADQLPAWESGQYHHLPLDPDAVAAITRTTLRLQGK